MCSSTHSILTHRPNLLLVCHSPIWGHESTLYIRTLAVITELQLCICTLYTAGARFAGVMYKYMLSYHVCTYSRWNGMLHSNIPLTGPKVTNVSVTESVEDGNLTLNVSWTTPKSELPITEYEVEYIVRVRALSEIGAGAWSEEHRVRIDDSECL